VDEQINSSEIAVRKSYDAQLRDFEEGVLDFLARYGLPTQSILVPVNERVRVFQNFDAVMSLLDVIPNVVY